MHASCELGLFHTTSHTRSQPARVRGSPMCTCCAHRAQKLVSARATIHPRNVNGESARMPPRKCADRPGTQKSPRSHARTYSQHAHVLPPLAHALHVAQPVSCPITYPCSQKRAHDGLPPITGAFRIYEQLQIRSRPWMALFPEACRLGCMRLLGTRFGSSRERAAATRVQNSTTGSCRALASGSVTCLAQIIYGLELK